MFCHYVDVVAVNVVRFADHCPQGSMMIAFHETADARQAKRDLQNIALSPWDGVTKYLWVAMSQRDIVVQSGIKGCGMVPRE